MQTIEIVASILGLICVVLTVRRHIACWPVGLAMVMLYIGIFYQARLYSDMLLQVVYVFLQIYGWHAWLHGQPDHSPLAITPLPLKHCLPWLACGITGTLSLGTFMHVATDASFPYLDALVTVASLIAQWLMGRKVLESWLVWIFVDCLAVGLYFSKELYPTAVLYLLFLLLAIWGWLDWRVEWKKLGMASS
ncbi:MAG TPA: nicotinamide riboside transporter PnuC [Pirellulaceae bacterium]|nr:nicotinamide riboside transporter PnuC [Pirellulaceae bacterium]